MSLAAFPPSMEGMERVWEQVRKVEEELARQVGSQVGLVAVVGKHTLSAGGKRLRPALVALSAHATGLPFAEERAVRLGACMEMIHMATLIHDDVIDHAQTRRGKATAAAVFGNTASILSGDVLLSKAMALLAADGDLEIIRCVAESVVQMAEGEVLELEQRGRFDLTVEEHLRILEMKTAVFIQACCEVGAMIAEAPQPARRALGEFGYHLGMAFQIIDDILDYRGDHAQLGKMQATDFREGCATLPLLRLLEDLPGSERDRIQSLFGNGAADSDIQQLVQLMEGRGALQRAAEDAAARVAKGVDGLQALPESSERRLLESVGEFVLVRQA